MSSEDFPIASFFGTLTAGMLFVLILGGLLSLPLRLFLKDAGFRRLLAVCIAISAGFVLFIYNRAGTFEEALLAYLGEDLLLGLSSWVSQGC